MASAYFAPRFLGSVDERVHACELELFYRELAALSSLDGLTPNQRKLKAHLRVMIELLRGRHG